MIARVNASDGRRKKKDDPVESLSYMNYSTGTTLIVKMVPGRWNAAALVRRSIFFQRLSAVWSGQRRAHLGLGWTVQCRPINAIARYAKYFHLSARVRFFLRLHL